MPKSYTTCPDSVRDRVDALIAKHHPELKNAGVKVDLLFVVHDAEDKPALTHGGYACLGVIRKTSTKERAAGRGDAEMTLDEARYVALSPGEQDGLLDHELQHLFVVNDGGTAKRDPVGRPVLKMRKHDRQFGWFDVIARRHGENSCEVRQARELIGEAQQTYFGFMKAEGKRAA